MICVLDEAGYCARHKRKHAPEELRFALADTPKGEKYRQDWDTWLSKSKLTEEEKKIAAEKENLAKKRRIATRIATDAKLVRCGPCSEKAGKDFFLKTGANMPVENALLLLNEPPGTLNPAWPATADAYRIEIGRQAEQAKKSTYPEGKFSGRGIVIAGGGVTYFGCAWVCASMLRWLGCKLPIELWFLGRGEMDSQMALLAKRLDITLVDAREVAKEYKPRILNGWELKPFAVLYSAFEEVMFLDADSIPVQNPEFMFDAPGFLDTGAVFWPDMAPYDRKEWLPPLVWERCGMEFRNYVDFESGQLMVNKRKCWDAMQLTLWMNYHSDYWYKIVFGDKSTWHLAWHKVERKYAMPEGACGWQWPAIIQHDFSRRALFVHCVRGKGELCISQRLNVPLGEKMQDAGRVLDAMWRRRIWDEQDETPQERSSRLALAGRYRYIRVGLGERVLELLTDGSIGEGNAACEKRWTARILDGVLTIVIVGESHKASDVGMMFLEKSADGVWRGAWEFHERCPVEFHLVINASPPSHWFFETGSFDRDIWDCVNRDNEYRLSTSFSESDVVVDVGAHRGSFAWAALTRGCGWVFCVESSPKNYAILMANVAAKLPGRVQVVRAALVASDAPCDQVFSHEDVGLPNTGGGYVKAGDNGFVVPGIHIEKILQLAAPPGRRIRFLKLDCEGGERWALTKCKSFGVVDEIAAEIHGEDAADLHQLSQEILTNLNSQGFSVAFFPDAGSPVLGKIFANRSAPVPVSRKPEKKAIAQMGTGIHLRLLELCEPRHLAYCKKHGIDYVVKRRNPEPGLPPSWGKIRLILDLFEDGYDQVTWLDSDVTIDDLEGDVTESCSVGIGMAWYNVPFPHFQAGVLVCNKSPETIQLLRDVLASGRSDPNSDQSRATMGLWEQPVLNSMGRARNLITQISPEWNCVPRFQPNVKPRFLATHGDPLEERASAALSITGHSLVISAKDRLEQMRSWRRFNDDDEWLPKGMEDLSARINGVAGLIDLLAKTEGRVKRVLEIGSFRGVSTEIFLLHGMEVVSVDPEHDRWRFTWLSRVYPNQLQMESMTSKEYFASHRSERFDLIYLDGQHGYEDFVQDLGGSLPMVADGGWLAGHDFNDVVPGSGVIRAIREKLGEVEVFSDTSWLFRVV